MDARMRMLPPVNHDRRHNATDRAFWYATGYIDGTGDWAHPHNTLNDFPHHYTNQYCTAWDSHAELPYLPACFKAWLTDQTAEQV